MKLEKELREMKEDVEDKKVLTSMQRNAGKKKTRTKREMIKLREREASCQIDKRETESLLEWRKKRH